MFSAGIQTNNFTNSPVISIGGNQRNPTSNYTYHGHTTHTTNLPESHKNYHDGDSFYNTTAGNGNIIGGRGNRAMNHDIPHKSSERAAHRNREGPYHYTPPAFDSDNEQGVGMPTRPLTADAPNPTQPPITELADAEHKAKGVGTKPLGGRCTRRKSRAQPPSHISVQVPRVDNPQTASKVRSTASRSGTGDERKHGASGSKSKPRWR